MQQDEDNSDDDKVTTEIKSTKKSTVLIKRKASELYVDCQPLETNDIMVPYEDNKDGQRGDYYTIPFGGSILPNK